MSPAPTSSATIAMLLRLGATTLADAQVESPGREARLLLAHALGRSLSDLLRDRNAVVDGAGFAALLARRAAREPMALIVGRQGFWTLDLAVSADTLVPRADSEALVEAALLHRPDRAAVRRVLDLGTGTGCLLLAALSEFPGAWGLGVELSAEAARLARDNARACGLGGRASILCGSWADAIGAGGGFDLVLSNPPYIAAGDIAGLMPEVALHEPRRALDGGPDGLGCYQRIVAALPGLLAPEGVAVLELGEGQEGAVRALAGAAGLVHLGTRDDLGGVPRALVLGAAP
ncbi:MAG: peptide chain release factor N(5)-glutamine methyltransferase [Janthinobacterium lividum]